MGNHLPVFSLNFVHINPFNMNKPKQLMLCALLAGATQFSTAQHKHTENEHHSISIDMTKAFADFDEKAALKMMDEKNTPANERAGYLKYLKGKHLQMKYPGLVYVNENTVLERSQVNKTTRSLTRSTYCSNAGFEMLDFTGWLPEYGTFGMASPVPGAVTSGINASQFDATARHTILTTLPGNNNPALGPIVGFDEIAIHPITGLAEIPLVTPLGSGVSVRLGNAVNGAQAERLSYTFTVTPDNSFFYYHYAIVLQDPFHAVADQPYFKVSVKDGLGNVIGGICGDYNINSTLAATDTTFIQVTYEFENLYYRNWEFSSVNLNAYIGQTITLEFEVSDCSLSGHFGYAYIDADCSSLLSTSFCSTDSVAAIAGPDGYDSYQWLDPMGNVIPGETSDTLFINAPTIGDTFSLQILSQTGCVSTLQTAVQHTTVSVAAIASTPTCVGGSGGSVAVYPAGTTSGYNFLWSTGDTTQVVYGLPAGTYSVHIESDSAVCGSVDTSITVIDSIVATAMVHDFCDMVSTNIIAGAGTSYTWYNMSGTPIDFDDTLTVMSPLNGMQFIVAYDGVGGCRDSVLYLLNETPSPGSFSAVAGPGVGEITLSYTAAGSAPGVIYSASNASGYSFNSGYTTSTSMVLTGLTGGVYTCSVNDGGCVLTINVNVGGLGVDNALQNSFVSIYPNPANNELWLAYTMNENNNTSFELVDETGRKVLTQQLIGSNGSIKLNVNEIAQGVYFYQLKSQNKILRGTTKIVISR